MAAQPDNFKFATKLARRYFELVSAEGDPRYIGYAQAVLSPWWKNASAPVEVLIVRATLKQYGHDFVGALADLEAALVQAPSNAEALSLAATIHMVQGRYGDAKIRCESLKKVVIEVMGVGCFSMLDSLEGKGRQARATLQAALDRDVRVSIPQRLWVLTRLGEMSIRIGEYAVAEQYFRNALALGVTDGYLLAAYADLLLDQERPAEVLTLLKGMRRSDILFLRIALAEKALKLPEAEKSHIELAKRFQAARMRGDKVHQAEEARFRLHLDNDSHGALWLAKDNWAIQKETRDGRILLESAIATRDKKAAEPVITWLKETKIEDVVLQKLAMRMGS